MAKKTDPVHYVDNKKLYEFMVKYIAEYNLAKQNTTKLPKIPNYVGECILKIAKKLSYKNNFIGYTQHYKEEMIGDGIENCIAYMHNFNPEKSNNPFAYFTMIVYNAFLHRLAKEQKHMYVKYKMFENMDVLDDLTDFINHDSETRPSNNSPSKYNSDYTDRMGKFVKDYETKT